MSNEMIMLSMNLLIPVNWVKTCTATPCINLVLHCGTVNIIPQPGTVIAFSAAMVVLIS